MHWTSQRKEFNFGASKQKRMFFSGIDLFSNWVFMPKSKMSKGLETAVMFLKEHPFSLESITFMIQKWWQCLLGASCPKIEWCTGCDKNWWKNMCFAKNVSWKKSSTSRRSVFLFFPRPPAKHDHSTRWDEVSHYLASGFCFEISKFWECDCWDRLLTVWNISIIVSENDLSCRISFRSSRVQIKVRSQSLRCETRADELGNGSCTCSKNLSMWCFVMEKIRRSDREWEESSQIG